MGLLPLTQGSPYAGYDGSYGRPLTSTFIGSVSPSMSLRVTDTHSSIQKPHVGRFIHFKTAGISTSLHAANISPCRTTPLVHAEWWAWLQESRTIK